MSTWRERLDEEAGSDVAWDWLIDNYHYPTLAVLLLFALYTRTLAWGNFLAQGTVLYNGNDPYYHLRSVQYVVENFPATMPFDPWTNFALGTSNSQFGTLFDQLIAAAALVVGLGSPTDEQVRLVVLFAPAIFGTLTLIPAYYIGRRLGGRFSGVVSAGVLAFAAGGLYFQGWVGTSDHHVAEALFQALAVLGTMAAVTVAQREKPVYELLAEREFAAIRPTIGWSLLAGAAVGAYLLVWPPGVLLLGILGVFYAVYLSAAFLRGYSPEHVAIAGVISMTTAGVIALSTTNTLEVSATARSILQPGLAFAVAGGCAYMAWLARRWDERDAPRLAYPGAVVGTGLVGVVVLALVSPPTFDFLVKNVLRVVGFGLGTSGTAATVGEISPMPIRRLWRFYQFVTIAAILGLLLIAVRQYTDDDPPAQELLLAIWFVFVLAASLTQQRFSYYLTIPIAALTAVFVGSIASYVRSTSGEDAIETHQVLTIGAVVLILLAPMLIPALASGSTALSAAPLKGPGDSQGWQPSLAWLEEETPEPGQYQNPDGDPMEYRGTFARTDDYDYPEGAYGIISWWDYGHWITANGERIPVANPFQQGAVHAANFLLAQDEDEAREVLAEREEADAKTQLVMVDWKMVNAKSPRPVNGKFFAPTQFKEGVNQSDYFSWVLDQQQLQAGNGLLNSAVLIRHKQPYYESMVVRLYHYHGSAKEPVPFVVEWQGQERPLRGSGTFTYAASGGEGPSSTIRQFDTMSQAREYVAEAPGVRQVGGIGTYPTERVSALEHYRLVHVSPVLAFQSGGYQRGLLTTVRNSNLQAVLGGVSTQQAAGWLLATDPAWTKTFERVEGATIEGTNAPPNQTVRASVTLQPNAGQPFTYSQQTRTDEQGTFTMTVPYATTDYDEWGVADGYTNTSVRAVGPYNVTTATRIANGSASRWFGQVEVTEGQVLGEDDSSATVRLSEESSNFSISSGATRESAATDAEAVAAANRTEDGTAHARPTG